MPITVRDGTETIKGSHRMGEGWIFLKTFEPLSLMMTYQMSLISAGFISLYSTFNVRYLLFIDQFPNNKLLAEHNNYTMMKVDWLTAGVLIIPSRIGLINNLMGQCPI